MIKICISQASEASGGMGRGKRHLKTCASFGSRPHYDSMLSTGFSRVIVAPFAQLKRLGPSANATAE